MYCICIYTIYISILRAVCMHRMYLVRQSSDWELQIVLELAARSHGDFSSALERSALEKFRAETMLGGSFIAVVKARGDKPKDGISPWQQDCNIAFNLYPIIWYHIWNGSGTWCCIVHLSLSWIIQSNIRTAPMLLAVWAVSSHCFHCFIGAGKTFDLQPRGSVERSEMWMVWTWTVANWFRIFESNFPAFQRSEISKQPTMWRSPCWCVCRTHGLCGGWVSGMIFVGLSTTCRVFLNEMVFVVF